MKLVIADELLQESVDAINAVAEKFNEEIEATGSKPTSEEQANLLASFPERLVDGLEFDFDAFVSIAADPWAKSMFERRLDEWFEALSVDDPTKRIEAAVLLTRTTYSMAIYSGFQLGVKALTLAQEQQKETA